jgi:hypothetical protein
MDICLTLLFLVAEFQDGVYLLYGCTQKAVPGVFVPETAGFQLEVQLGDIDWLLS